MKKLELIKLIKEAHTEVLKEDKVKMHPYYNDSDYNFFKAKYWSDERIIKRWDEEMEQDDVAKEKKKANESIEDESTEKSCVNYKCKKCGSTYKNLKKPLNYSNCVVEKPITGEKCNGQLIPIKENKIKKTELTKLIKETYKEILSEETKNWVVTYYDVRDNIISSHKIEDRTEHEAENEAMADQPTKCADWTLIPESRILKEELSDKQIKDNFKKFTTELAKLSKKYSVAIQSTGGVEFGKITSITYSTDHTSYDLTFNAVWE